MSFIKYIPFTELSEDSSCVLCLGNFDGVHIGHAELVRSTIKMKDKLSDKHSNLRATALCFSMLPANYFGNKSIKNLITLDEKIGIFKSLGLDGVYVCDFGQLYNYSPERFICDILFDRCNAIGAVCGFNYSFGAKASGSPETLGKYFLEKGYSVQIVDPVKIDGKVASSTLVRECISLGDFEMANAVLGRAYSITHTVVHGKNLGTKLGFPTINHVFNEDDAQIIPAYGIYATKTEIDGALYTSVTNVGTRPTVSTSGVITCETHIIDTEVPDGLYGKTARVYFFKKLRDEMRFSSKDELSAAIANDVSATKEFFKK